MRLFDMKLLTITCEILAQRKVNEILEKHRIQGYTAYEVGGKGDRGIRGQGIPEDNNVKIEIILRKETADMVVEEIIRTLFADYGIVLYTTDIQVARTEKFI